MAEQLSGDDEVGLARTSTVAAECVTNLVRAGSDLVLVAELTGRRGLETTRRFSSPSAADRQAGDGSARTDEADWRLLANTTGCYRLGFAALLRFLELEGTSQAVTWLARGPDRR